MLVVSSQTPRRFADVLRHAGEEALVSEQPSDWPEENPMPNPQDSDEGLKQPEVEQQSFDESSREAVAPTEEEISEDEHPHLAEEPSPSRVSVSEIEPVEDVGQSNRAEAQSVGVEGKQTAPSWGLWAYISGADKAVTAHSS